MCLPADDAKKIDGCFDGPLAQRDLTLCSQWPIQFDFDRQFNVFVRERERENRERAYRGLHKAL